MVTLVTGGSGVLGMHVVRRLAEAGENVVAVSRSGPPEHAGILLQELSSRIAFVPGDVADFSFLLSTARDRGVTGIVHAAALTGEAQARARPRDVFNANVTGTANVLEVARQCGVRRVVYLGSASEYGRRADQKPISEEEVRPEYLYAETKHLGHRLGQRYREVFGLDFITVRVSSVYGPHTRFNPHRKLVGNTLIAHVCRAAALGEPLKLEGGGDYPRDWTYAADAAQGVYLAYHAPSPAHAVYNVASGRSHTVREVLAALSRVEPDARVEAGPGRWDDDPFQAGNLRGPLDISRARRDLGYVPRYGLEEGLREYISWWRSVSRG